MKFIKIFILFSFIIFYNYSFSQVKIVGNIFTAYNGTVCKGKFSTYFYKQLEFKDNITVKIVEYQKRDYKEVYSVMDLPGKEYKYIIKNNFITIIGTELKQIKIDNGKLIWNELIFKKVKGK